MSSSKDPVPDPGEARAPNTQIPDKEAARDQQAKLTESIANPEIVDFLMLEKSMREFVKDLAWYRAYPLFETGNLYGLTELTGIDLEDLRKLAFDEVVHLKIQLEEIKSRIGDGWADSYFAAIEAHKAIKDYAERFFSDGVTMEKLGMEYHHALPPEDELKAMLRITCICIEYLS